MFGKDGATVARNSAIAYTIALSGWFILWRLYGDATWWLMALNRYAPDLFVPAPLLLGLFFVARRWSWLLIIPILFFAGLYGPILRPPTTPPHTAPAVRVLNFNVLYSNEQPLTLIATHLASRILLSSKPPDPHRRLCHH